MVDRFIIYNTTMMALFIQSFRAALIRVVIARAQQVQGKPPTHFQRFQIVINICSCYHHQYAFCILGFGVIHPIDTVHIRDIVASMQPQEIHRRATPKEM
jgi:hypothetical protein